LIARHKTIILLALFSVVQCLAQVEPTAKSKKPKARPPGLLNGAEVAAFLSERFASGKNAIFCSRDGKLYGMDSDSVVSFGKENSAVIGEYGYTYKGYSGTYAVSDVGIISIALKGYRGNWPEMRIAKEKNATRLYTNSGSTRFVVGGRGGAVETDGMKPFWPFRLVESGSTPKVTPIWSGGEVRFFTSPVLPESFEWKGNLIKFRLDFNTLKDGKVSIQKHWPNFSEADWELPAVKAAMRAMESWTFYPYTSDDEPVEMGRGWNFEVRKVRGQVRWIVKDDVITVFDSMPRERDY
jgi:hypothetical protein